MVELTNEGVTNFAEVILLGSLFFFFWYSIGKAYKWEVLQSSLCLSKTLKPGNKLIWVTRSHC